MTATSKTPLLDRCKIPAQVRKLKPDQLRQLADELRIETIDAVSVTGGHPVHIGRRCPSGPDVPISRPSNRIMRTSGPCADLGPPNGEYAAHGSNAGNRSGTTVCDY